MPADNIWDLAVEQSRKNEKGSKQAKDSVVLIMGNKKAGKTSISYRFVERTENPKPSIALEYLFGRRSRGIDMDKEICHIWELGGGTLFTELLEVPITAENASTLSVILVLDLSVPEELWFTLETLLQAVKKRIDIVASISKDSTLKKVLGEHPRYEITANHEDKDIIDPFPVPLLIFGSKYDIFQDFDPEKKKIISKTLRFIAHVHAANLLFISNRSENLVNKGRVAISNMVFGSAASKMPSFDYNKPIYVPFGSDSIQSIGTLSSSSSMLGESHSGSLESWKRAFVSHFPQIVATSAIPDDPGKDPHFKEKDIDMMKAEKDKELEEYKKNQQRRRIDWP